MLDTSRKDGFPSLSSHSSPIALHLGLRLSKTSLNHFAMLTHKLAFLKFIYFYSMNVSILLTHICVCVPDAHGCFGSPEV